MIQGVRASLDLFFDELPTREHLLTDEQAWWELNDAWRLRLGHNFLARGRVRILRTVVARQNPGTPPPPGRLAVYCSGSPGMGR